MNLSTPLNKIRNLAVVFSLILLGSTLLSSCRKNNDEPETASLRIVHSLAGTSSIDVFINRQPPLASAILYSKNSAYFDVYSGTNEVIITDASTNNVLVVGGTNLKADSTYSLFITNKSANTDSVTAVRTHDDLSSPPAGKAKIRFVHLVQNALELDLGVQGGGNLFTGKIFKSYTNFTPVDPGPMIFELKDSGTATVRAASAQAVNIEAGKIYTIWASGLINSPAPYNAGIQVIQN